MEIKTKEDKDIPTVAKFEVAENYSRDYQLIKYKSNIIGLEHLMMHEPVHLQFIIDAHKDNSNTLFVSKGQHRARFINDQRHQKTYVAYRIDVENSNF